MPLEPTCKKCKKPVSDHRLLSDTAWCLQTRPSPQGTFTPLQVMKARAAKGDDHAISWLERRKTRKQKR